MIYDLIIIGGGPAGMSAALYASRQNLKFLFITKQLGGMANYIPSLSSYLGYGHITGYELVDKYKKHLNRYKVKTNKDEVTSIKKSTGLFSVRTKNKTHKSKAIIIATGRKFKKLNIPGEEKFKGKGLSDCSACDGPLFKNKTVAVIGGGRTGLFSTLFLLKIAKKIYLIEKSPRIKTGGGLKKFAEIIRKSGKVTIITNTKPTRINGDQFADEIVLKEKGKPKKTLPVDGVFAEVGYEPNTDFLKGLLRSNARNEIIIDEDCKTSIKGIFAAGDVTHLKEKQVIVSAGEGAKATLSAILYLEKSKA